MTIKEPMPVEELHKIRVKFNDELKDLSDKEKIARINKEAIEFLEKKGMVKLVERFKRAA